MKHLPHGEAALPLLAVALFGLAFVAWPLVDAGVLMRPLLSMTFLITVLSGLYMVSVHGRLVAVIIGLGTFLFALQLATLAWTSETLRLVGQFTLGAFLLLLCGALMKTVMGKGRVTPNRIIGAVVVYSLLAIQFAMLFSLIERFVPGSFLVAEGAAPTAWTSWGFFYLSMITLTSLGLSDITPVHAFARSMVMLEALFGQLYTTLLLARLVSLEVAYQVRKTDN